MFFTFLACQYSPPLIKNMAKLIFKLTNLNTRQLRQPNPLYSSQREVRQRDEECGMQLLIGAEEDGNVISPGVWM
jgi:hypothetical protein